MKKLGCKPDPHDPRDYKFKDWNSAAATAYVGGGKLVDYYKPIDQLNTSSCVANSVAQAACCARSAATGMQQALPSRLGIYWQARAAYASRDANGYVIESEIADEGTWIRSAVSMLKKLGMVNESKWRFDTAMVNKKPPPALWFKRTPKDAIVFRRVSTGWQSTGEIATALDAQQAVVFATDVSDDYCQSRGAERISTMSGKIVGRHAQALLDYDYYGGATYFLCANSWGSGWRANGCIWLHESILASNLTDDIWALEAVK